MIIETERLILRPWREDDAEVLYGYAKDPGVGPSAGWPVHTSIQNSREIIRQVLQKPDTFAVTLRGDDRAIGSIGIFPCPNPRTNGEPEIGYWIAVPFWGQGLIPEAVRELLRIGFNERREKRIWCGHYEGNEKSKRVIEKCGFIFEFKEENDVPLLAERRMELFYSITKEDFLQ